MHILRGKDKRLYTATTTYLQAAGVGGLIERHTFTRLRVFAAVLPPSRVPPLFAASRAEAQLTNNLVTARYRAMTMLTQLLHHPVPGRL